MNRYLSSEKWDKCGTGWYRSPDGQWQATEDDGKWTLSRLTDHETRYEPVNTYLTLADCQEIAARRDV